MILLGSAASTAAEPDQKRKTSRSPQSIVSSSSQKLLATREVLIERMKASRDSLKNSLPLYEEKLAQRNSEYETSLRLYEENLIALSEVENNHRALTESHLELERIRELIAEDDKALSLAEDAARENWARLAGLPLGAYDETATLIRYNGAAKWSLAMVAKIAKFYRMTFGHPLPISAMGQSSIHDRLGLDHRESLDVAVRPDSEEGRRLMLYLRAAGIPFLAFRGQVPSMSTGAHIHVGKPSPRIIQVKQKVNAPRRVR